MNADDDKINEAIWAYLHGEMDAGRRCKFEKELGASADLRARLARAGRVDAWVRGSLGRAAAAVADSSDEALTDEILAAFERDQSLTVREDASGESLGRTSRKAWQGRPFPLWRMALGAAAALAIAVAVPALFVSPQARWAEPEFVPVAYRGAVVPAAARGASPLTASRCQEALSSELARVMASRGAKLPAGLILSLRVQELRDGAFSVCVRARFRDGREAGEWTGDFSSAEAYVAHVVSSAEAIANGLSHFSGAEGVGGRP